MLNKVLFLLAAATIVLTGCVDEELSPVVTQETLLFGAFPFLNELRAAEFDLANLNSSAYEMEVYFVDNEAGSAVAQYNLYVSFDDNNPSNGDLSTTSTLYKSFGPSDFSATGSNGNLGLVVSIPFSEVAGFVGAGNAGDVISGDRFQFRAEIVHADGRVFSESNSTSAITTAFGGIWDFNVNATCPLDNADFSGSYGIAYGNVYEPFSLFNVPPDDPDPVQPLGDLDGVTVNLETVAGSTTRRTVAYGARLWLPSYGFALGSVTLNFACDVVSSTAATAPLTCGDGSIGFAQDEDQVSSFNLDDDTTFEIFYLDFASGGCLDRTEPFSLIYTKQ